MDKYIYWLDNVSQLGWKSKCILLENFCDPEAVYRATEKELRYFLEEKKLKAIKKAKNIWDVEKEFDEMQRKGIRMTVIPDDNYPQKLRNIPDPPFAVYYLGALPKEIFPSVAVIGARECSEYGKYIAYELGKCLGGAGIQLISGMARGIDGISQEAALEAGGSSYGIVGCGADICYPKSNRSLYERLCRDGGVLSIYPPGTMPQARLFPPRNRIVSGLADVLVVIEARQRSGTSITVEMALEQGRDIYAVPGRITDRLSDGCNKMLREGASVFLSPEDFLEELKQLLPGKMDVLQGGEEAALVKESCAESEALKGSSMKEKISKGGRGRRDGQVDSLEAQVLSVLDLYPLYVEVIAERIKNEYGVNLSISDINVKLMELCLCDLAKQEMPGWFTKVI